MGWAIDLDGVMWLGEQPITGSAEAITRLVSRGDTVVFVTNNSSVPVGEVEAKLARQGVDALGRVVTSAQAAASLVAPGERVFVCGGPGIVEALDLRGARAVDDPTEADAVVVGFTRAFDFELLSAATQAVRAGARLIGTNSDSSYPTPEGLVPGGGAILAAVAAASETEPEVAGKPNEAMAALVRARLGPDGIMVGDRPDTDGRFATALGYRFGLVHTGVTSAEATVVPDPWIAAPDLAALVDRVLDLVG